MPIFFFDFCHGPSVEEDESGVVFESAERAYIEAYETALAMWIDLLRQRLDPQQASFRVRNEHGALLFVLPFSELLEDCRDGSQRRKPMTKIYREIETRCHQARKLNDEFLQQLNGLKMKLGEARRLASKSKAKVQ